MKKVVNNIFKIGAFLLLAAGAALPINAAEPTAEQPMVYEGSVQKIKVGDTIQFNKDSLYYLTGQRISKWVYKKKHTVQQVGGNRYPNGVLIRGIYSWVYPGTVRPVTPLIIDSIAASACGEYYWDATGLTYTESGDYLFEGKKANGNDSVVNLRLTVNPIYVKTLKEHAYGEYLWDATGVVYTESGEYTFHGTTEQGCDSILTLHLTVDSVPVLETELTEDPYEIPVPSQTDRFSVGVRGGFATNFAGETMPLGFDALLDLRYAHYWSADKNKPSYGIMTGLSVGYMQTFQSATIDDQFTLPTDAGDLLYKVSADKVSQSTRQIQLEVPVMFALATPKGFFLNVGPKFILPVYSKYHQEIVNPNIYAYKEELNGNPIINEVVTGVVTEEQANYTGNLVEKPCKLFSLALGAELGYEFRLKNGHTLDLGVYADYSLISAYKGAANPTGKIINITAPSATNSAVVDVLPISGAEANKYGFLDAGVKISYNFDFVK